MLQVLKTLILQESRSICNAAKRIRRTPVWTKHYGGTLNDYGGNS